MIKIAIADDHTLFKSGIITLLQSQPDMRVLFDESDGRAFIDTLALFEQPDVALIDLEMPVMNGIALTSHVRNHYPSIKTMILSAYGQERYVVKLIELGASAFLSKDCAPQTLFEAIRQTAQHGFYLTPAAFNAMQKAGQMHGLYKTVNHIPVELTPREIEVLKLICRENTNQEIAQQLFVSVRTAEGHRNSLLLKTGSKNTAGLVMFAIRHGIAEIMP